MIVYSSFHTQKNGIPNIIFKNIMSSPWPCPQLLLWFYLPHVHSPEQSGFIFQFSPQWQAPFSHLWPLQSSSEVQVKPNENWKINFTNHKLSNSWLHSINSLVQNWWSITYAITVEAVFFVDIGSTAIVSIKLTSSIVVYVITHAILNPTGLSTIYWKISKSN